MPFDEGHLIRGAVDYIANRSVVGTVLMHPLWFAAVLVAIIVLILAAGDGSITFKLIFYMFAGVGCAVLAHDALIEQHNIEINGTSAITDMVEDMQVEGGVIEPRPLEEMPDTYLVDGRSSYVRPELTADQLETQIDRATY